MVVNEKKNENFTYTIGVGTLEGSHTVDSDDRVSQSRAPSRSRVECRAGVVHPLGQSSRVNLGQARTVLMDAARGGGRSEAVQQMGPHQAAADPVGIPLPAPPNLGS